MSDAVTVVLVFSTVTWIVPSLPQTSKPGDRTAAVASTGGTRVPSIVAVVGELVAVVGGDHEQCPVG